MIMEKMYGANIPSQVAFVDWDKVFDNADRTKLFNIPRPVNINFKGKRIGEATLMRKGSNNVWGKAKIEKGVRQGFHLSFAPFKEHIENALKK